MGLAGFIMSIVGLVFVFIAFLPFLGWLNWFIIPFAVLSFALSLAGIIRGANRLLGIIGLILSALVIVLSTVRLIAGLGVI
jgi:hypothetical protein